jgi:hypothetical protein
MKADGRPAIGDGGATMFNKQDPGILIGLARDQHNTLLAVAAHQRFLTTITATHHGRFTALLSWCKRIQQRTRNLSMERVGLLAK